MTIADAETVGAAVARFVEAIEIDPVLAPHWRDVDLGRLRHYARGFALRALGGPEYALGDATARRSVALDDTAFDRIESLLAACLADAGVSGDVVGLAQRRLEEIRALYVEAGSETEPAG